MNIWLSLKETISHYLSNLYKKELIAKLRHLLVSMVGDASKDHYFLKGLSVRHDGGWVVSDPAKLLGWRNVFDSQPSLLIQQK